MNLKCNDTLAIQQGIVNSEFAQGFYTNTKKLMEKSGDEFVLYIKDIKVLKK